MARFLMTSVALIQVLQHLVALHGSLPVYVDEDGAKRLCRFTVHAYPEGHAEYAESPASQGPHIALETSWEEGGGV